MEHYSCQPSTNNSILAHHYCYSQVIMDKYFFFHSSLRVCDHPTIISPTSSVTQTPRVRFTTSCPLFVCRWKSGMCTGFVTAAAMRRTACRPSSSSRTTPWPTSARWVSHPADFTQNLVAFQTASSECQFPFVWEGETYTECTKAGSEFPWCALEVDSSGVLVGNRSAYCTDRTVNMIQRINSVSHISLETAAAGCPLGQKYHFLSGSITTEQTGESYSLLMLCLSFPDPQWTGGCRDPPTLFIPLWGQLYLFTTQFTNICLSGIKVWLSLIVFSLVFAKCTS